MGERRVAVNGVELNVLEDGAGPPVVLCHGFPELAYSWRKQVPALVRAGYRAVVSDMRGYGKSSAPGAIEDYDIVALCGDMCGLLDALGEEAAIFVGHDWGAIVTWNLAILHPERVRAVAGLSVPFVPRPPAPPIPILRARLGEDFYLVWFQPPGVADAVLAADVRATFLNALTRATVTSSVWGAKDERRLPSWLSEEELAVYVEAFQRTGFTGPLNWYRNMDRNWELTERVAGRRVEQPAMFLTGERDPVRKFSPGETMAGWLTDMRANIVVPGAGHWVQQQAPQAVNEALLDFLAGL